MNDNKHNHSCLKQNVYTLKNAKALKKIPILDDGQIYLYVIHSLPQGNIKIGKTTNIVQRIRSLSGSNGAGNKINAVWVSPESTYLHSMESTAHNHFDYARIKGTEWFNGNKVTFEEVVEYVDSLFHQKGYKTCNELRKKIYKEKKEIE